jgi:ABC-type uncharacterized transport system auxiliary subunit
MKLTFRAAIVGTVCALVAAGCLTRQIPEKHRYMVVAERTEPAQTKSDGILLIGRIHVVPGFDRRNFVYQTGPTELEDDFYNEFYITPREMIRANVIEWIDAAQLFSSVVDIDSLVTSRWVLEAKVDALFVDVRGKGPAKAIVGVEFSLLDTREAEVEITMAKKYRAEITADSRSAPAFVEAWSEGLGRILAELERDLAVFLS